MKRKKTLIILGAALVAAIAGIIIENLVEKHVDKVNTVDEEVLAVDPDSLTTLSIEYEGKTIQLDQSDEGWSLNNDDKFPIDQENMQDFLQNFESVHASFIIEDVEDYSQYGLSTPTATIEFTTADGTDTLTFGTFSTMDEKRYICINGGNVYLIDEDLLDYVSSDQEDYLARDSVPEFTELATLNISGDSELAASYDPDDDYEYYATVGDEKLPLDTELTDSYLSKLSGMDLTDYVTYAADPTDLSEYGLDSPELTIEVAGQVAKEDSDETEEETNTVTFAKADDETVYVHFDDSAIVYTIDSDTYDSIAAGSYYDLRPREVVDMELKDAKSIECTLEGTSYTIDVDYNESDGCTYSLDGEDLELTSAATRITGLSLTEAGEDYTLGQEELSFTVNPSDKKADAQTVVLYRLDGNSCVATLNGQTIGLVSRDSMSGLREALLSAILNAQAEN